ncbi:MAG: D-alanine--D-alanine ligase [Candidatus Omnitrophica bacterium]|jgi:D-alanine-D-alanine ligase|nr:D-alanine--D-alanine ligase [Candidatus Omnitrophota bacterium]
MDILKDIKVGVLGGGVSSEREISLLSANEAYKALRKNSTETVFIDITVSQNEKVKEIILASNIDLAFIALHGEFGEDGKIQKILEELNIPYTGSGSLASYLAMDKIASKEIFIKNGIPTAGFIVYEHNHSIKELASNLKYPLVVKPFFSGSSVGVSIVRNKIELERALKNALLLQPKIIIEDYIEGREFTVGILEDKPLAVVEIVLKSEYFDFTTKYSDGLAEFIAPAKLDKTIYKKIQDIALAAHCALGCKHFSRVDIRLGSDCVPYVLEVNSIPGLTTHSLLPLCAKCCGIDFDELIIRMAQLALDGKNFTKIRKN